MDIVQKGLSFSYLLNFFWTVSANISLIFLSGYLLDNSCAKDPRLDAGWALGLSIVGVLACLYHILALNLHNHYGVFPAGPVLTKRFSLCGSPENDYMHLSISVFSVCDLSKVLIDGAFDLLYLPLAFFAFVIKKATCDSIDFTMSRAEARAGDKYLYYFNPCKSGAVEGVFDKESTARDIFGMTMFLSLWAYIPAILLRGDGLSDVPAFALESGPSSASYTGCSEDVERTLVANDVFIVGFFFLIILNILSVVYANSGESMNKAVVFGAGNELGDPVRPSKFRNGVNFDHGEYGMGSRGMP